jgi:endonuclease YncB( thermonuclease family)
MVSSPQWRPIPDVSSAMRKRWGWVFAGFCWICSMAAALAGPAQNPRAQSTRPVSTHCHFEDAETGKVAGIIDGRSFVLDDGREVRLAGIEVPPPPGAGESGARAEAGLAARAALQGILADQVVELRHNGAAADRYGRILAHVFAVKDRIRRSAVHEMLAQGFAQVSAHVGERLCANELLARERAARISKLGLWGEPYYVVRAAESSAELSAQRGHFTVVEGKVVSVRESGGTIYVNFGRRWSQALTVTIAKRNERTFSGVGLEPRKLENRRLRVRGWVEERNGPRIEATRPEQIELAERN